MKNTRQRFQTGSLRRVERKDGFVWEYRFRDHSLPGSPQRQITLAGELYPTEAKARAAVQHRVMELNGTEAFVQKQQATMGALVERFIETERLREVKALRPGEALIEGAVQYSTACSYLTTLERYIKPFWNDVPLTEVKPAAVEEWLRKLTKLPKRGNISATDIPSPLSPKTRGHIKAMMHRLMERAMFWELVPMSRNPIGLVEIKGISKRSRKPLILTMEQFHSVLEHLEDPYRKMVQVAMCLGLRVSEILALKWSDFDFEGQELRVVRGVVHRRIGNVKTEYSEDDLPLDPDFAELMLTWRAKCPQSEGNWVFPNPNTGEPYHASTIQQDYIRAAGRKTKLPKNIGWHTFRHTYRSFLDDVGTPIGVQQKLMRHAHPGTTMNYGNALMESKRQANSKVVRMVLPMKEGLAEAV